MLISFAFTLAFFNMTGILASRMLLGLFALELGADAFRAGLIAATFSAFPMLLSVTAGKFADRHGSRWSLLIGTVGSGLGMLLPYLMPGYPALFTAAALSGLSFAFFNVAMQNLVGTLSDPSRRVRNFSNFSLVISTATLMGPLLGGFSIDHSGHARTSLYLALLYLAPLAMLALWGGRLPPGKPRLAEKGSIRKTLTDPKVWRVLATSSLVLSGIDLFSFYIPVYGHHIKLSASAIGILLGTSAAAGFVIRIGLTRLLARYSVETVLAYAFFLGAVSFALMPLFTNMAALTVLAFIFGLGMGCGQPITMMLAFSQSAQGRSGEAMGLRLTVNHMTRVVGPMVFGSIGSAFGLYPVFWINALLLAGGGLLSSSKRRPP